MLLRSFVDVATTRLEWDIADIFRKHWREYMRQYGLSDRYAQVIRHIIDCRTAALGGYKAQCDTCGKLQIAYCSCRDRHCPKCGAWERAQWLAAQEKLLLPIPYFHIVFTTDHAINPLVTAGNDAVVYDLLFRAATETLKEFGQRELGGELGITAVLHTWGQQLSRHIHLHTLVTGGALGQTEYGRPRWQASKPNYLCDIVAVAETFRDKFCAGLLALYQRGELVLRGAAAALDVPALVARMQAKKWEVYARVARPRDRRRAGEGVGLLWALRESRRHRQLSDCGLPRGAGEFPVLRQPRRRERESADPRRGGVHPAFFAARLAERLYAHPALWPTSQPQTRALITGAAIIRADA